MTTPYGTSTFSFTEWGSGTGYGRFVEATDPRNWTERVLYSNGIPPSYVHDNTRDEDGNPDWSGDEEIRPTVVGADTSGTVLAAEQTTQSLAANNMLHWGSTWYWNKEAYGYHPPGDPSNPGGNPGSPYENFEKARHTHWMTTSFGTVALGVPASTRGADAAGYRSFNIYENQVNARQLVDSSRVIKSVQRVRNEAGTVVDRLTQTAYNAAGALEQVTDPRGRITKYEYDTNGIDLRFIKQLEGVAGWKVLTEHIYGGTGAVPHKPTTIKNASGDATTYEYNSYGQLKLEINAKGEKTRTNYDANGFLTSVEKTDPANAAAWVTVYTVNSRDSFKRVSSDTDALGYTKTYLYDALNRIERIDHPNPGGSAVKEEFFYTNNGVPSAKIIELGRYVDKNNATTRYYYNGNRQLSKVRDNLSQEVEYEYCRCGHMKLLIDERDKQTQWAFDLNGRVTEKTFADGTKIKYGYQQESGLLAYVWHFPMDGTLTWTQSYYVDGNLQSIAYGDNSKRTMTWDTINRLKEIIIQAGTTLANGDKKVTWDYNADSQRYKEMAYTHNGSSWVLNSTVYFIWEGGTIIQKRIGGTTAYSCTNYFEEGEMRCLNNALPTKYYYTRDHLGSVYEMTNTAAAVQAAYSYVAYGERTKRWGASDTEIAYTGHWNFKPAAFTKQAAADLSLTWFRAYDTKRGNWLSRDPIGEKGGRNLYGFVGNNGIRWIDAWGLKKVC